MLRVTADVFSGRPNPEWIIEDEAAARDAVRALTREQGVLTAAEPPDAGLGLRGLRVEALTDDLASDYGLPASVYLPLGASGDARSLELADRLVRLAPEATATEQGEAPLRAFLTSTLEEAGRLDRRTTVSGPDGEAGKAAEAGEAGEVRAAVVCQIERGAFNPGFWNDDATVRANNNCYNYASNWRTNTFAQPGRGCGHMYTAITCAEVTRGALCDGMHHRYDCFPDTEKPRYLVALVLAPGPGFVDYHWYRLQKEGFWGHKPGGTAARNVDNSNRVITNPETADRGPYTIFCGYFYGCNSQRRRIR